MPRRPGAVKEPKNNRYFTLQNFTWEVGPLLFLLISVCCISAVDSTCLDPCCTMLLACLKVVKIYWVFKDTVSWDVVAYYTYIFLGTVIISFAGTVALPEYFSAALSLLNLLENNLGRSKLATRLMQAQQHTVWNISTIFKPYWTAFYRTKMSTTRCEWVRLFISWQVQSAYSSVRSRC